MTIIRRLTYWSGRVIKSIFCLITYQWEQYLEHYHGPDYQAIIQDYDNELRAKIKYTDEEGSYEDARDILWEVYESRGLSIWD